MPMATYSYSATAMVPSSATGSGTSWGSGAGDTAGTAGGGGGGGGGGGYFTVMSYDISNKVYEANRRRRWESFRFWRLIRLHLDFDIICCQGTRYSFFNTFLE